MGQVEVYELLRRRYESGDKGFYSINDIRRLLAMEGLEYNLVSVRRAVLKLEGGGFIEGKTGGTVTRWLRKFRFKKVDLGATNPY